MDPPQTALGTAEPGPALAAAAAADQQLAEAAGEDPAEASSEDGGRPSIGLAARQQAQARGVLSDGDALWASGAAALANRSWAAAAAGLRCQASTWSKDGSCCGGRLCALSPAARPGRTRMRHCLTIRKARSAGRQLSERGAQIALAVPARCALLARTLADCSPPTHTCSTADCALLAPDPERCQGMRTWASWAASSQRGAHPTRLCTVHRGRTARTTRPPWTRRRWALLFKLQDLGSRVQDAGSMGFRAAGAWALLSSMLGPGDPARLHASAAQGGPGPALPAHARLS